MDGVMVYIFIRVSTCRLESAIPRSMSKDMEKTQPKTILKAGSDSSEK